MNTIVDSVSLFQAPVPTLADWTAVRGSCPRTVPSMPEGAATEDVVRFCPDCGSPVRIAGRDAAVPCRGCGVVHGAGRFAVCWGVERRPRGWSVAEVAREIVALAAYLWDPNAYAWVRGYWAVRGWA